MLFNLEGLHVRSFVYSSSSRGIVVGAIALFGWRMFFCVQSGVEFGGEQSREPLIRRWWYTLDALRLAILGEDHFLKSRCKDSWKTLSQQALNIFLNPWFDPWSWKSLGKFLKNCVTRSGDESWDYTIPKEIGTEFNFIRNFWNQSMNIFPCISRNDRSRKKITSNNGRNVWLITREKSCKSKDNIIEARTDWMIQQWNRIEYRQEAGSFVIKN